MDNIFQVLSPHEVVSVCLLKLLDDFEIEGYVIVRKLDNINVALIYSIEIMLNIDV